MSEELEKALKNKETDLQYIVDMEENMNKFADFAFRSINKSSLPTAEATTLYGIVTILEEIGDEYKKNSQT